MDQNRPNAGDLRRLQRPYDRVAQQGPPQAPALERPVDRQPPEHHDRHGVRHVSPDASGSARLGNGARRQSVVTDDPAAGVHHVGARRAAGLIRQRATSEPFIEFRDARIERRQVMARPDLLRGADSVPTRHFSHGAFDLSRRRSFAFTDGGLSSAAENRFAAFSSRGK